MNKISEAVRKELAALAGKSDEDIDFSDIPATTERDWEGAVRGKFYRPDASLRLKSLATEQHESLEEA